jgi:hypothetical protein
MAESYPHYDDLVDDLAAALNNLALREKRILALERELTIYTAAMERMEREILQQKRDIHDMNQTPQTIFVRCGCGRIKSQGLVCPTIAEGGSCEHGQ